MLQGHCFVMLDHMYTLLPFKVWGAVTGPGAAAQRITNTQKAGFKATV
jgi:hypothetical protein